MTTAPRLLALSASLVCLTGLACSPSDRSVGDGRARDAGALLNAHAAVLTIATPADADALLPPLVQTTQGQQASDLLFDHLATPGDHIETVGDAAFRPQLAQRWSWAPDSLSIAFALDPAARWHDGVPVRAADVRFSFALYTDSVVASPHRHALDGIDSVSVRDSLTAVVWWRKRDPEQFYQVASSLAILPEHLLAKEPRAALAQSSFASQPVGSGRYRFERWTPHRELLLTADTTNYRGRPGFGRVVWVVTADPTAANMSVLSGQTDVLEQLRGDAFVKARQTSSVRTFEYGSLDYAYMVFNVQREVAGSRALFGDRAMRAALTAAIDRPAVVRNALDSLGAVALGPFTRGSPAVDSTMRQIGFDAARAGALLDSLGWRLDSRDSLRRRNGRTLSFEILVPASSATRQRVAVLLQAQLRSAGVQAEVSPLEPAVFYARLEKGDFDAALNMWRSDPSPASLKAVWGSPRGTDVGMNFGRYASATFDALVDSASFSFEPARRTALLRKAYQTIVDDAAAVWLYEPRNFAAINARVEPVGMRADAWWAAIPDWRLAGARGASVASRVP